MTNETPLELAGVAVYLAGTGAGPCVICMAALGLMSPDLDIFAPYEAIEADLRWEAQKAASSGRVTLCDKHYAKAKAKLGEIRARGTA